MTQRWRLRDTVEVFDTGDDLLISHGAADASLAIRGARTLERVVFERLRGPAVTAAELRAAVCSAGQRLSLQDANGLLEDLDRLHLTESPEHEQHSGLAPDRRERHNRQMAYFADVQGQRRAFDSQRALSAAHVVVLGCGGLGSWTAVGLAEAGVGHLTLVDHDVVELSNLGRQLLFTPADLGRAKVEVIAEHVRAHDPEITVETVRRRVDGVEAVEAVIRGAELLIATADHPPQLISRWVDSACWKQRVPWISGGQFPPLVRIGPLVVPGRTSCLECLERAARRTHARYDRLVEARQQRPVLAATTGSASALVGALLANDAVAWITGLHAPATLGAAVTLDLTTLEQRRHVVAADQDCPRCGGEALERAA